MNLRRVLAFAMVASLVVSALPSPSWAGTVVGATSQATSHELSASIDRAVAKVTASRQLAASTGYTPPVVRAQSGGSGGGGGGGWIIWTVLGLAVSGATTYYVLKQMKKQTNPNPNPNQ